MELNDALRIPLAPSVVREALQDLALLRASFDHCESLIRLAHGEYALTLTVPLGPLRARLLAGCAMCENLLGRHDAAHGRLVAAFEDVAASLAAHQQERMGAVVTH